jgi:hypothetical protein
MAISITKFYDSFKESALKMFTTSFGKNGAKYVTGPATVTGVFTVIYPMEDGAFGDITGTVDDLSNQSFVGGIPIYGTFRSIEIVSGSVILYK